MPKLNLVHSAKPISPDDIIFTETWPKQKWHLSQTFKSEERKGSEDPTGITVAP